MKVFFSRSIGELEVCLRDAISATTLTFCWWQLKEATLLIWAAWAEQLAAMVLYRKHLLRLCFVYHVTNFLIQQHRKRLPRIRAASGSLHPAQSRNLQKVRKSRRILWDSMGLGRHGVPFEFSRAMVKLESSDILIAFYGCRRTEVIPLLLLGRNIALQIFILFQ